MNDARPTEGKTLTANVKSAGCAAKMSAQELRQVLSAIPITTSPNLLAGIEHFEDAAVYKISEDLAIVQTVDFFPPVVDDPFLYGAIAAANALSDVYAMGGKPILALNVLCFPTCDFPIEVVQSILKGGASQVQAAGAVLAGGHSIQSQEPVYGLCVTGLVNPKNMLTNGGAIAGDQLVLCKALGTGVGLLGLKARALSEAGSMELFKTMTTLNANWLETAIDFLPHAATDITGFGLVGHLHEMSKASGLTAVLWANRVPLLPEVKALADQGFVPAGAYGNRKSFEQFTTYINDVDLAVSDLLFDPQTSGGLLFAMAPGNVAPFLKELEKKGMTGDLIGELCKGTPGVVEVKTDE